MASRQFTLGDNIHIWVVDTKATSSVVAHFKTLLASDELSRAARYRFAYLRDAFIISRGVLRILLGYYLSTEPASIQLAYDPKGKPTLGEAARIGFNTTHSNGIALLAFAWACEVGVDIEQIRSFPGLQELAERFFSPEEVADLNLLPTEQRERGFFLCWTRKEAYLKAIGDGLTTPLDSFRVTLLPEQPARLVHIGYDKIAAEAWTLHDLSPRSGYAAALAYRGERRPVHVFSPAESAEFIDCLS